VQPLKAIATFFAILAVQNAGLWMDLPWWTPWLMWLPFAACLVIGRNTRSARATGLLAGALWGGAAAAMGWIAVTALLSRLPPAGPVAEISSPLPDGRYLVVNGGSRSLTNSHLETLYPRTPRQASHRGQSHGIELVGLTAFGRTSTGWREREPSRYAIFGTPVLAPCAGTVVRALDGRTDMAVPIPDSIVMAGNHVLLRCGRVEIFLAHLRKGRLSVSAGARVRLGQKLGEAGNSGNSDTPHLHVHAQLPGSRDAPPVGGADPAADQRAIPGQGRPAIARWHDPALRVQLAGCNGDWPICARRASRSVFHGASSGARARSARHTSPASSILPA
jgi:hypothetical protein